MEYVYLIVAVLLLILAVGIGWVLTVLGMPGNWLIVLAAALYSWLALSSGILGIGLTLVITLAVLAGIGELVEFLSATVGARKAGGSRTASVYALGGSLLGAIAGGLIGMPIPIIGSAIAAVLGGALGAFAGAAYAEHRRGEQHGQVFRVGKAAFSGRLMGTGFKAIIGALMVVCVLIALIV